jgi:rubrerythrin
MHISNERYFRERQRHDLALRMIRHEARTCTIRSCTGLTEDRIRKLYKAFAEQMRTVPLRRKRGKSPRQIAYFTRTPQLQLEASVLASTFIAFGLLAQFPPTKPSLRFGQSFCAAYEMHRQLPHTGRISFEHAWFLWRLLSEGRGVWTTRCRQCHGYYLRDDVNVGRQGCPMCKLKAQEPRKEKRIADGG